MANRRVTGRERPGEGNACPSGRRHGAPLAESSARRCRLRQPAVRGGGAPCGWRSLYHNAAVRRNRPRTWTAAQREGEEPPVPVPPRVAALPRAPLGERRGLAPADRGEDGHLITAGEDMVLFPADGAHEDQLGLLSGQPQGGQEGTNAAALGQLHGEVARGSGTGRSVPSECCVQTNRDLHGRTTREGPGGVHRVVPGPSQVRLRLELSVHAVQIGVRHIKHRSVRR